MRLVVLRALGLGDFLTGVPAYRALHAAYPEHELILAAPRALGPLAALTGAVDRLLHARELEPLEWSGPPPDVAVDLHGSGPLSHRVVEALGARQTFVFASPQAPDANGPWWDPGEHEVSRWCRLLEWYGVPADPDDLSLRSPGPAPTPGAVVLHPGASSGSRRWPAERFSAVARALRGAGHRVLITGTPDEEALRREIAADAGLPSDAVPRTGLLELAALVAEAAVVISNDTGTSHLATAYGTPSVTLFGPVSPGLWGPPGNRSRHVALWHGTGDRPGDAHGRDPDPRLLQITAGEVLDAAATVIRPPRDTLQTI
jgi:ADP-heptose:LPS heptosyltransferase